MLPLNVPPETLVEEPAAPYIAPPLKAELYEKLVFSTATVAPSVVLLNIAPPRPFVAAFELKVESLIVVSVFVTIAPQQLLF